MNKKVMIVTLLIVLVLSLGSVYAQTSQEQAAKDLNEIQLLKGDGKDLNLSGELTRAEGATFIVRLLGVEEKILTNKIDYLALGFSDVFGTDWFSPYVGYCVEEGIIDGYSDGTFRANEKLSEQAFVKMILGAMDYEHGVDYSWAETFSFAYSKGVLTEESYKDMVSNTRPYTRGKVVQLLHHVLSENNADGTKVMVDTLVAANVLTRDEAISYGFIKDPMVMKVNDFKQNSGSTFTVLLNEVPKALTTANIIVKEKNSEVTLEVTKVLEADIQRMYYITVENQVPDKEYIITLTGVEDAQGNVLEDYAYEFFGYRGIDYDSLYYRVARAELQSMNRLDITFTQPVDINEISAKDLMIKKDGTLFIGGDASNMSLEVDGSNPYVLHVEFLSYNFTIEGTFEVVVSKATKSLYGVNIKDGADDSARFSGKVFEAAALALSDSILESEKSIVLVFNKNINVTTAEQIFSYYLTKAGEPLVILKAEVVRSGENANKAVRLTMEKEMIENGTYALLINQAYDTSRNENIIEQQMDIVAKVVAKPSLTINSVKTTASNRVEVILENYLDEDEAINISNYSVKGNETGSIARVPSKVYYDRYASMPMVVLEFASKTNFVDGKSYEVVINKDMKLDSGLSLKTDAKKTFVDVKSAYATSMLKKAMYIGNSIILVKGNTEFALDIPNVLNKNYELQYLENEMVKTLQPIGVEYFNEHIILLRFENIDRNVAYSLKVKQIKTGFGEMLDTSDVLIEVLTEELR